MTSKAMVVHGKTPVDLAAENRRLRVENAHFRGLVFYDEMFRDTIKANEKEISRLTEAMKKANGANIRLKIEIAKLEKEIDKLKNPKQEPSNVPSTLDLMIEQLKKEEAELNDKSS